MTTCVAAIPALPVRPDASAAARGRAGSPRYSHRDADVNRKRLRLGADWHGISRLPDSNTIISCSARPISTIGLEYVRWLSRARRGTAADHRQSSRQPLLSKRAPGWRRLNGFTERRPTRPLAPGWNNNVYFPRTVVVCIVAAETRHRSCSAVRPKRWRRNTPVCQREAYTHG